MPLVIQGKRFYSIADVVESEGVSRQTLWRWRGAGYIPAGKRFRNGQILFSEMDHSAIRAYANRLEPAEVDRIDGRSRYGKTKTKNSAGTVSQRESL